MHSKVYAPRGASFRFFVGCAAAMLGAVFVPTVPLLAQFSSTQSTVATATDAVPWVLCSASDDQAPDARAPQTDPGHARVVVRGDTMSLEVRACTLTQLLSLISERTGIRITVSETIPPLRLSLRTRTQSIEATIRELLRDADVFVLYAAEPPAEQRLAAVWAYPRGSTGDIEPVPAELWASTQELQRQLTEGNPELRARAIEELIARAGDAALSHVLDAFADENADIRLRALDAALAATIDVPLQDLHALVLNDLSPEVRLRALQALEERSESALIIEAATHDPDSKVRREAQSILRRVNQSAR
jgi:hypothetical protein